MAVAFLPMRSQSNSSGPAKPVSAWRWACAVSIVGILLAASCAAQTPKHPGRKARSHAAKPAAAQPTTPAPVPEAPKPPAWPANEAATPPSITWDSQGLRVQAVNSSLRQILNEVAARTGAKVTGIGPDERIFGVYGPGPARDVLSQILHGTNYNVLMIGDQGQGAPREVVLSARNSGPNRNAGSQPLQNPQADDDVDTEPDEQPQQQPPAMQPMPPNAIPGPLHTPQERMQEMQRQQMEMQRQQQQQLQQMQEQQNQQQQ